MRLTFRNKQQLSENLLYVLVWTSILLVPVLNSEMTSQEKIYIREVFMSWLKVSPYLLTFILHNNVVAPRALKSKNYGRYFFGLVAVLLSIFGVVDYTQREIFPQLEIIRTLGMEGVTLTDLNVFWNIAFALVMCSGNMGIKLIYKSMRDDQLMEELKHQSLQVEMNFLKYQINPHFFMNTLNNIHALIDIDSTTAKNAVIELSKMMRHVLYESGYEHISLRKELQFVHNYIELMKIRFDNLVSVEFNYPKVIPPNSSLPPLLMIVFVENAFKHGLRASGESFVKIDVECTSDEITMQVVNSLAGSSESSSKRGGIGLINVRKRLELLYNDQFVLRCERRKNDYFVHLKIPIKNA